MAGTGFDSNRSGLQNQLVAREHGFTEFHMVHGQQDRDFPGVFQLLGQQDAGKLGHGLNNEDSRHDGLGRKVPLEKGLVDRDVFDADGPAIGIHFNDTVYEQEGVSVGQYSPELNGVHLGDSAKSVRSFCPFDAL